MQKNIKRFKGLTIGLEEIASDDFNRANDSAGIGANWLELRSTINHTITSNTAGISATGFARTRWAGAGNWSPNQYSKLIVGSNGSNVSYGVGVRCTGGVNALNTYDFVVGFGSWNIYRTVAEANTTLASSPATLSYNLLVGDVFELQIIGSLLTAFINRVKVAQVVDTVLTTGVPMFENYNPLSGEQIGTNSWAGGNILLS